MAVIKNGKTHGRIGNVVYRVVNGVQVAQSRPVKSKEKRKATELNKTFAKSSTFASSIYQGIKEFGLNAVDHKFYLRLVSIAKAEVFSEYSVLEQEQYENWNLIPNTDYLEINPKSNIDRYFGSRPSLTFEDNEIIIKIPEIKFTNQGQKNLKDANHFQITVSVIYYEFDEANPYVDDFKSDVFSKFYGSTEIEFRINLSTLENPVNNNLIVICYGLFFLSSEKSNHYLNSKDFNPVGVLGMYYKK